MANDCNETVSSGDITSFPFIMVEPAPSLQVGDWAIQTRHAEGKNPLVRVTEIRGDIIWHIHEGIPSTSSCNGFENFKRITEEEAMKMRNNIPTPPTLLPVDTPVIIIPGTQYDGQAHGTTGTITSVNSGEGYCYSVTWGHGGSNSYRINDITPADPQVVEQLIQLTKKVITENIIKVSTTVYTFLQEELKEFNLGVHEYPFTYLLGEREGIIKYLAPLHGYGGCKDMQHISPYSLTRAVIILFKKKARAIGIVKVGRFSDYNIYDFSTILKNVEILWGINKNKSWIYKMIKVDDKDIPMQIGCEIIKRKGVKKCQYEEKQ